MTQKIVVVDDEVYIRALLEQTLEELEEEYDVEVFSASDGQEGLELIQEEKPDLVFMDVMMPKMNGYEVCQKVKQIDELTHIKIILLTAKGQEADRQQGLEAGASNYVTKPFDPDALLDMAVEILGLDGS